VGSPRRARLGCVACSYEYSFWAPLDVLEYDWAAKGCLPYDCHYFLDIHANKRYLYYYYRSLGIRVKCNLSAAKVSTIVEAPYTQTLWGKGHQNTPFLSPTQTHVSGFEAARPQQGHWSIVAMVDWKYRTPFRKTAHSERLHFTLTSVADFRAYLKVSHEYIFCAICTLIGWLASLGYYGVSVLSISQSLLQILRFSSSKLSFYYAPRAKNHNVAEPFEFAKRCKCCACTSQGVMEI
jgi:hypothetical protein